MVQTVLQFGPGGPPLLFRLVALFIAVMGLLNVLKPKEMLAWSAKTQYGVRGTVEPSDTRAFVQRIVGVVVVLVGLSMATGIGLF